VQDQTLYALDRECKTRTLSIDCTEALFKLALAEKQYAEVSTRPTAEPNFQILDSDQGYDTLATRYNQGSVTS
jgi:hypothetical protein